MRCPYELICTWEGGNIVTKGLYYCADLNLRFGSSQVLGSGYEVYRDIPPYVNPKPLDCGKGCLCLEVTGFGVGRTTLSNKPQVQEVSGFAVGTLDLGGGGKGTLI